MPLGNQLPQSMLYNAPETMLDGAINWTSFKPLDRSTFEQDSTFKIRVGSLTDFLIPQRSYLRFDLKLNNGTVGTPVAASSNTTSYITSLGGASVIRRLTTTVGGRQLETIDSYNEYCSHLYKRLPATQQEFLKVAELYKDDRASLNQLASQASSGRTIFHALRCSLLENDQYIPLPFCRGGVEFEIQLETLNRVCASSVPGGYTIENVEFIGCMIRPNVSYMSQFNSKLSSGGKASMPLQIIRNLRISPSATTEQTSVINLGFFKSLKQVSGVQRSAATLSTKATDSFANDNLTAKSYYWQIGSERYPKNFEIQCNSDPAYGAVRIENQMQAICSLDNTYGHFSASQPISSAGAVSGKDDYVFYNWASNPSFGSGVPVEDGVVNFVHSYNTAPADTDSYDFFFQVEGKLSIGYDSVDVDFKDL